jgi:hypothetical protein
MQAPGGVRVEDRTWHGKRYPACFVASEALDWLMRHDGMRRATAETLCRFLWRIGRIHHVVREAAFADDVLFFRFAGTRAQWDGIDLARLEADMRGERGLDVQDRSWRGRDFARCFVGVEAVEWIMARTRLAFGGAEAAGQSLLELGALRHVADEHGFIGDHYFYRLASGARAAARAPAVAR